MGRTLDTPALFSRLRQVVAAVICAVGILFVLIWGMMAYVAWTEFPPCTEEMVRQGSDCLRAHH